MDPRPIPKRHGKSQNFKAATALTLGCGYSFTEPKILHLYSYVKNHRLESMRVLAESRALL